MKFVLVEYAPKLGWWYVGEMRGEIGETQIIGEVFNKTLFRSGETCPDLTANDLRELAGLLDTIEKGVAS